MVTNPPFSLFREYVKQLFDYNKKFVIISNKNSTLCAIGHDANKSKLWKFAEMDADHVAAWSKGGGINIKNCQLLCKTHNRAKGNR